MLTIGTLFSGIGAVEHALEKLNTKYTIKFASDNGNINLPLSFEEILEKFNEMNNSDISINNYVKSLYKKTGKINHVKNSYFANYAIKEDNFYDDVRFLDGEKYIDELDMIVGGSPCQSFSVNGKRLGLEDTRGTLFYDFARIVSESRPKVFIYENVPGLLSHDKGSTWETVTNIFDDLDYHWDYKILNARDYGLPQNRRRVFVVGYRKDIYNGDIIFPVPESLETEVEDFLDKKIDEKYLLPEKGFNYTTNPKNKKRVSVDSKVSRCQAANQQFNWCGDFRFVDKDRVEVISNKKAFIGIYENRQGYIRKLKPRECLRLMGFNDNFKIVVPDRQMYHQSGNSIAVPVLEKLLVIVLKNIKGEKND